MSPNDNTQQQRERIVQSTRTVEERSFLVHDEIKIEYCFSNREGDYCFTEACENSGECRPDSFEGAAVVGS